MAFKVRGPRAPAFKQESSTQHLACWTAAMILGVISFNSPAAAAPSSGKVHWIGEVAPTEGECPFEFAYLFDRDVLVNETIITYYQWSANIFLTNNMRQDVGDWKFAVSFTSGEYLKSVISARTEPPLDGIAVYGNKVTFSALPGAAKIVSKYTAGAFPGDNIFQISLRGLRLNPNFPSPQLPAGLEFFSAPRVNCTGVTPIFYSANPSVLTYCCKEAPITRPPTTGPETKPASCLKLGQVACNGRCIAQGLECCNSKACDPAQGQRCANERKSLCCQFGEMECNGLCLPATQDCCGRKSCGPGEICANVKASICCKLGEKECQGKCIAAENQCCSSRTSCKPGTYCATRSLCCPIGQKACRGKCVEGGAMC